MNGSLEQAVRGVKANSHARILVVGVRGDNLPEEYRRHPQIICWDGDEGVRREIPSNVRLILVTRFLQHRTYERLRERAELPLKLMGTGEIRKVLEPLFDDEEEMAEKPLIKTQPFNGMKLNPDNFKLPTNAPDQKKWFGRGEFVEFVRTHLKTLDAHAERANLEQLMHDQGYDFPPEGTINSTIYKVISERRPKNVATPPAAEPYTRSEVAGPLPPSKPAALQTASLDEDDQELVRMLDDVTAAIALVKDAIVKRSGKRTAMKRLLEELKGL